MTNSVGFDPFSQDSMDPNDPNSIMYDPAWASRNGAVQVLPGGVVVIIPPDVTSDTDNMDIDSGTGVNLDSPDSRDVDPYDPDNSGISGASQDQDWKKTSVTRALRDFGKIHD